MGFIILLILRLILTNKILEFYNFDMRKIYVLITYLLFFPILIVTFFVTALVVLYYAKNKFKRPLLYFLLVSPSLVYLLVCILSLFGIYIW